MCLSNWSSQVLYESWCTALLPFAQLKMHNVKGHDPLTPRMAGQFRGSPKASTSVDSRRVSSKSAFWEPMAVLGNLSPRCPM